MSTMPDHLRPITVHIPVTWTPEQALAVWEMLDELREKIWTRYSCQLQDLLAKERQSAGIDKGDAVRLSTQSDVFSAVFDNGN